MNDENQSDYDVFNLEDLQNFAFKEYKELQNDKLILKLLGALPVNIEKEFVPRYVFDIVLKNEGVKIGFVTLRAALTKKLLERGGHIGYGIYEKYRGHSYAAKALLLLKPFITDITNGKTLITCDTDNIASRKTIEKFGAKLIRIVEQIENPEDHTKKDCCYYELIKEVKIPAAEEKIEYDV